MPDTHTPEVTPQKGVRGFELDMHLSFIQPLTVSTCHTVLAAVRNVLQQSHLELYQPAHDPQAPVPSARLTGPLKQHAEQAEKADNWDLLKQVLTILLRQHVRIIEAGQRGLLRSAEGYTEWMPWRRNVVVPVDFSISTSSLSSTTSSAHAQSAPLSERSERKDNNCNLGMDAGMHKAIQSIKFDEGIKYILERHT